VTPKWLFFPTQSSTPQYIQTISTNRVVSRGTPSTIKRRMDGVTDTESGSLVDQFASVDGSSQIQKMSSNNVIRWRLKNSDTSSSEYGTKVLISNALTSATITVGSNVFTAASVFVGATDADPRMDLTVSDGSAGTFWTDNNLDDTDDIIMTLTLTF